MPRSKDFVYIPVPVKKDSQLYKHLRDEAARKAGILPTEHKQIPIGPYVADLLDDRDRALYGQQGQGEMWVSTSTPYLQGLIETAVYKAIGALPADTALRGAPPVPQEKPVEVIEEAPDDALAAAWGADDDEEEE